MQVKNQSNKLTYLITENVLLCCSVAVYKCSKVPHTVLWMMMAPRITYIMSIRRFKCFFFFFQRRFNGPEQVTTSMQQRI